MEYEAEDWKQLTKSHNGRMDLARESGMGYIQSATVLNGRVARGSVPKTPRCQRQAGVSRTLEEAQNGLSRTGE